MEKKQRFLKKGLVFLAVGMLMAMLCGMTASAATYTLSTPGKIYSGTKKGTNFHKVKVSKTGVLGIQAYCLTSSGKKTIIQIGLLNSKGQPMEKKYRVMTSSNSYSAYYGVKKGTYYIATYGSYAYRIQYKVTGVTENSGSSQSSAKTIDRAVVRNGLVTMGESRTKSDWYKIRIVNRKSFQLSFSALTNGGDLVVQVQIPKWKLNKKYVCGSGENFTRQYQIQTNGVYTGTNITAMAYIRVYRKSNYAPTSGAYSLKWT
ncbi:MAG: hypothetical protein SOZ59_12200 [Candidatus Limivivens sp.]|nr:hypothetical protein [Candidatus Limivivens sp.]